MEAEESHDGYEDFPRAPVAAPGHGRTCGPSSWVSSAGTPRDRGDPRDSRLHRRARRAAGATNPPPPSLTLPPPTSACCHRRHRERDRGGDAGIPSIIAVETTGALGDGGGSGVVYSADGYVITNHHVVSEADELAIVFSDGDGGCRRSSASMTSPISHPASESPDLTPIEVGSSSI